MASTTVITRAQSESEQRIHQFIDKKATVKTFSGTINFVLSIHEEETADEFWTCFKDLMGRGSDAFNKKDKAQLKCIYNRCLDSIDKEEEYMDMRDVDDKFIGVKISMTLKRVQEGLQVSSKISYAMVDMSKEILWGKWKRNQIVKIIEQEHKQL